MSDSYKKRNETGFSADRNSHQPKRDLTATSPQITQKLLEMAQKSHYADFPKKIVSLKYLLAGERKY
jgi:hypothetical protein